MRSSTSSSCRDVFAAVAPGTLLSEDGTVFQRGTMPRSRSLDDLDVMRSKAFFDADDSDDSDNGDADKGWEDLRGKQGQVGPEQCSSLLLGRSQQLAAKRTLRIQIAPPAGGIAAAPPRYLDEEELSPRLRSACASPGGTDRKSVV